MGNSGKSGLILHDAMSLMFLVHNFENLEKSNFFQFLILKYSNFDVCELIHTFSYIIYP